MKIIGYIFVAVLASASAGDLHLTDGRVFTNITIVSRSEAELKFSHASGVATVPLASLSRADILELDIAHAIKLPEPTPPRYTPTSSSTSPQPNRSSVNSEKSYTSENRYVRNYTGSSGGAVHVNGYFRKNGTYVQSHSRRR